MKVLYIVRNDSTLPQDRLLDDEHELSGRDGFFLASLYNAFTVSEATYAFLQNNADHVNSQYDYLIMNHKAAPHGKMIQVNDLDILSRISIPAIIMTENAQAANLPPADVMDRFDLVFKREPYRDKDRYDLSAATLAKLCPTMIVCRNVPATNLNARTIVPAEFGSADVSPEFDHDIFFSGKTTAPMRFDSWKRVKDKFPNAFGGLQLATDDPLHYAEYAMKKISKKDFFQTLQRSRINLVLEGFGEFTYRHLEIWCMAAFGLSTSSEFEVELPFDMVDGVHFATFSDTDDLIDKINYYLNHPDDARQIASNGRTLFEAEYDFKRHGKFIADFIAAKH
jgi:hypothetical protein